MSEKDSEDIGTIARMGGLLGMAQATLERNRELLERINDDDADDVTRDEIGAASVATADTIEKLDELFNEWLKDTPDAG